MTITPNRPKALQTYLLNANLWTSRIGFLKVEIGDWPAVIFNEWDWQEPDLVQSYEKWIDIFPVLIDVVVKYEDYATWYNLRQKIRKLIGQFNGALSKDWEGTIAFKQFLAPVYTKETNEILFGWIYLLKQNYDYEEEPTPTPTETETETETEVLSNEEVENADNSD